jgi:hypothetical protein
MKGGTTAKIGGEDDTYMVRAYYGLMTLSNIPESSGRKNGAKFVALLSVN